MSEMPTAYLSLQRKSFCHFLVKLHRGVTLADTMIDCLVTATKFLVLDKQCFIPLQRYMN